MIRDRIKGAARKAMLKVFKMEFDAQELAPNEGNSKLAAAPKSIDPSVIPRVVDGSGDTPGPKHKFDIGRTWLASQVISNVASVIFDIRQPKEVVAGLLPGSVLVPGEQLKERQDLLPPKDVRITIVDQVGSDEATKLAEWLRNEGWAVARRLVGGYAEWIEHSEPVWVPQPPEGGKYHLGSPVTVKKGKKRGWVQEASAGPVYRVWFEDGTSLAGVTEAQLEG